MGPGCVSHTSHTERDPRRWNAIVSFSDRSSHPHFARIIIIKPDVLRVSGFVFDLLLLLFYLAHFFVFCVVGASKLRHILFLRSRPINCTITISFGCPLCICWWFLGDIRSYVLRDIRCFGLHIVSPVKLEVALFPFQPVEVQLRTIQFWENSFLE